MYLIIVRKRYRPQNKPKIQNKCKTSARYGKDIDQKKSRTQQKKKEKKEENNQKKRKNKLKQ